MRDYQVLFVCTGNSCRSPMAAGFLHHHLPESQRDRLRILSCGTAAVDGGPASVHAIAVMREKGIDIGDHRSRHLSRDLVEASDIIFVMEESHRRELLERFPAYRDNVFLLRTFGRQQRTKKIEIADPHGGELSEYRICRDDIENEVRRILPPLLRLLNSPQDAS